MTTEALSKLRGSYRKHFIRSRTNKPSLKIRDRHVKIIQSISDNRLMTFSLIAQLFPPNEQARIRRSPNPHDTAHTNLRRVLSALFHHSYLDRISKEEIPEHIYALSPKGAQLLRDHQRTLSLSIHSLENNRDFSNINARHALMVARFRIALEVAIKEHPTLSLYSFEREGKNIKTEWKSEGKRVFINPDAYFILRDERNPSAGSGRDPQKPSYYSYFLEADRSTMTLARLLAKYKHYSQMYQEGVHLSQFEIQTFRVLTVCKSRERASNITQLASSDDYSHIPQQLRSFFCFTTEESYGDIPQNVLAAVWRKADDPRQLRGIIPQPLQRL